MRFEIPKYQELYKSADELVALIDILSKGWTQLLSDMEFCSREILDDADVRLMRNAEAIASLTCNSPGNNPHSTKDLSLVAWLYKRDSLMESAKPIEMRQSKSAPEELAAAAAASLSQNNC